MLKARKVLGLAVFIVAAVCGTAAASSTAATPELLFRVPPLGGEENSSAAGRLTEPWGVAASPLDGHVFVAEPANGRISEFSSYGEFIKAWGWGVRTGAGELQTCTSASGCRRGLTGSGAGQIDRSEAAATSGDPTSTFEARLGLAVDPEGFVWVSEGFKLQGSEEEDFRIQKFSASGEFVLMAGGGVNKTTGANVCTAASGDRCGAGASGDGPGEFGFPSDPEEFAETDPRFDAIEVAADGTVFVGDIGRIEAFAPDGAFSEEIPLQVELVGHNIKALALDPAGGFDVSVSGFLEVRQLDATGAEVGRLATSVETKRGPTPPRGLATDVSGDIYVITGEKGVADGRSEVLEFAPDGTCIICAGDKFASESITIGGGEAEVPLVSLATNLSEPGSSSPGDVYVTAFYSPGSVEESEDTSNSVSAFGPPPRFESPPLVAPRIRASFAVSVGIRSATVAAEINSVYNPETSYRVEYGPGVCSNGGCALSESLTLGSERNIFVPTLPVLLPDLLPGLTYHYRFLATSGPEITVGPEMALTTYSSAATGLPDEREYEMVSPPQKNHGGVGTESSVTLAPTQATLGGNALTYASLAAFGPNPPGASGASQYVARRSPEGWATENVSPPDQEGFIHPPVRGFSEDLEVAALDVGEPPLVAGAPQGVENIYLRSNSSGELTLVTGQKPVVEVERPGVCTPFYGADQSYDRVFFGARGALTPDAPAGSELSLYEWSRTGGVQLVSVLPNGKSAPFGSGIGFGGAGESGFTCEAPFGTTVLAGAISADGSRVYWGRRDEAGRGFLYLRSEGESTQIDKLQGGPGPVGNGRFWGASRDGSFAFFTAPGRLTRDAGSDDLYRYDANAEEGEGLSVLAPDPGDAKVLGVLATSEDGRRAYFAAQGNLAPGAQSGQPNLFLWEAGAGVRYIATLSGADQSDWSAEPSHQTARTNPDGSALAFLSSAPLTSFDNVDQTTGNRDPEAYLFDARTGQLSCVSCNAGGARPIGLSSLPVWPTPQRQTRYLSDDGYRMFFMTVDTLTPADTNNQQDLYEFERLGTDGCASGLPSYSATTGGCVSLISSGVGSRPAIFVDASASGSDVFFGTPQSLLSQDTDENSDIYDARVGGGFPQPTPPAPECEGEACRATVAPPAPPVPGSSGVVGKGNIKPKHPHKRHLKSKRHRRRKHHRTVQKARKGKSHKNRPHLRHPGQMQHDSRQGDAVQRRGI